MNTDSPTVSWNRYKANQHFDIQYRREHKLTASTGEQKLTSLSWVMDSCGHNG